jgi:carnitine-CoA ligase
MSIIEPHLMLPALIAERAQQRPDDVLVQEVGGPPTSYREFVAEARRWCGGFRELEIGRGDTVVSITSAAASTLECWIGVSWAGAIEVPINSEYRGDMLADQIARSAPKAIVASPSLIGRLAEIKDKLPARAVIVVPGLAEPTVVGTTPVLPSSEFFREASVTESAEQYDVASIMFTSGTTGRSKGVVVPWGEVARALGVKFSGGEEDPPGGSYYIPWPFYNMLGRGSFDAAVRLGIPVILRGKFSRTEFWNDVKRYGCTHVTLPFIVPWLLEAPPSADDLENPLRRAVVVPFSEEAVEFGRRFGVRVSTSWASTEAGFPLTNLNPEKIGSVGTPNSGYQVRIVDEHDLECPPNVVGELIVRADEPWRQMTGYFNDPAATAAVWRNGWYHTGDSFYRDEENYHYFVGRLKDYIKSRAHNVSLSEIEAAVLRIEGVRECGCVGVPTALAGPGGFEDQEVSAFVVPSAGSALSRDDILSILEKQLPKFMMPAQIHFIEDLPKNELNKTLKDKLLALHKEIVGAN